MWSCLKNNKNKLMLVNVGNTKKTDTSLWSTAAFTKIINNYWIVSSRINTPCEGEQMIKKQILHFCLLSMAQKQLCFHLLTKNAYVTCSKPLSTTSWTSTTHTTFFLIRSILTVVFTITNPAAVNALKIKLALKVRLFAPGTASRTSKLIIVILAVIVTITFPFLFDTAAIVHTSKLCRFASYICCLNEKNWKENKQKHCIELSRIITRIWFWYQTSWCRLNIKININY